MPNDLELPKKFLKDLKLKRYDFAEDGAVIPRTINPGTILMMEENKIFCVHEKMNELDYCCNNLGSRFLSYSVSGAHHAAAMAKNAGIIFDGTTENLKIKIEEAQKVTIPDNSVLSAEAMKALDMFRKGDYYKY